MSARRRKVTAAIRAALDQQLLCFYKTTSIANEDRVIARTEHDGRPSMKFDVHIAAIARAVLVALGDKEEA